MMEILRPGLAIAHGGLEMKQMLQLKQYFQKVHITVVSSQPSHSVSRGKNA
ncbi:hypothetical protein I79_024019 [Cricetulus griseus]|uniref:Uncharacterized protein n=1 Tax=Cricetulus griseus TaxID=10029 RepID=G3IJI4_CRIGR|nr:hypothetical protein I79_024019 [Cricetulus griseus]